MLMHLHFPTPIDDVKLNCRPQTTFLIVAKVFNVERFQHSLRMDGVCLGKTQDKKNLET